MVLGACGPEAALDSLSDLPAIEIAGILIALALGLVLAVTRRFVPLAVLATVTALAVVVI